MNEEVREEVTVENQPKVPVKPIRETSKIVLYSIHLVCIIFEIAIVIGWFFSIPDAHYMLTAVIGLHGTSTAFYSHKARKENEIKLKQIYGKIYTADYEQKQNQYGYGFGYDTYNTYDNSDSNINGVG